MTSVKKILFGLVGVITIIIGIVLSQEPVSAFSVSPMKQTVSLVPGQTYSNKVTAYLSLDEKKEMHYEVSVVPFKVNDENNNYSIDLNGSDEHNEIVNWVSLSDGINTAKNGEVLTGKITTGEKIDFIYTINVPKSVVGGGQYFAVLVKSVPNPSDDEDHNVMIAETHSIASVVYVELSGEIKLDGSLKDNNINGFLLNPPIKTSFLAQNTGNTHFAVTYYLQVYPLFSNEEVYTNEEDPSTDYVLPGTTRYISQTWDKTPSIGIFKVRQTAYYDFAKDKPSVSERIVIICPIWLLFLIVFSIVALIYYFVARTRARRAERRAAE